MVKSSAERAREYRARNKAKVNQREQERRSERRDYYRQYHRATYEGASIRPFVGVDGEGRNLSNGYHAYFMLRSGDKSIVCRQGESRLRSSDALQFLSELSPDYTYVAYFFDYDVTKILEDLPWGRLRYLMDREKRRRKHGGFFPVDWNGYQIDYMPRKEFKVRKKPTKNHTYPWIVIHDVGTFFQTPFVDTLRSWDIGSDDQRDKIGEGKGLRAEFAEISDEYIDAYNAMECELLADLMERFREICHELDIVPRKWQGPGLLAEALLRKHGIPATSELEIFGDSANDVGQFGRYAYYGGWFETAYVGYTDVPAVQFDINSAYPYALQFVPCLVHGTWRRQTTDARPLGDKELSICFARFGPRNAKRFLYGGLPVRRKDGSIHHPFNGAGYYWSFELRSAIHQYCTIYDSYVYERQCDCLPFEFLRDVYAERKRLGKSDKGKVLKLAMNSVYGKLVQSIGDPRYSNPIWGSFITAWTRAQINNAIHTLPCCTNESDRVPCGQDVYMVATDAIFTRELTAASLDVGTGLGQWDRDVHNDGLFIVQPGMYFSPTGSEKDATYKTRGVPKRKIVEHRQEFMDGFEKMVTSRRVTKGDVMLPYQQFMGIRQALHRNSTKLLGQFVEYEDPDTGEKGRRTSFAWTTKRQPEPLPNYLPEKVKCIRTLPYWGTHDETPKGLPIVSVPYSKDIGGLLKREALRLDFSDQPDWMPR